MGRSKEAKNRRHAKRMAKRRAIKATKQAAYQARIAAGTNRKPKRKQSKRQGQSQPERIIMLVPVRINGTVRAEPRRVHGGAACKNVGCKRCSAVARLAA